MQLKATIIPYFWDYLRAYVYVKTLYYYFKLNVRECFSWNWHLKILQHILKEILIYEKMYRNSEIWDYKTLSLENHKSVSLSLF